MAIGDILSCVVRPDGWSAEITIAGFVEGATYDFGGLASEPSTLLSPKVALTNISKGFTNAGVATTLSRTLYGTHVVPLPYSAATIAGSFTTGSFVDGEVVTQAVSGATAVIVGNQSSGPSLRVKVVAGTPNTTNIWTGGTSAATFTPTATPVTLADASPDARYDGTNLVVRIALDEDVYAKDKTGAGNSGTNPTITIAAGWATNTGGGSQTSAAATALSCTNNSTLVYPKVVATWAFEHAPTWKAVTAATTLGCIANHAHGIACVTLSATDQHANVVSGTATTKTKHLTSSGLYYESYDLAVPITGFTAGDDVTMRYIAYPRVGDTTEILDTSLNTTSTDDCLGITLTKFRLPTTTTSIYVAATDHPTTPGSDATGTGTSALPYATIGKALSVVTEAVGKLTKIYAKAGGTTLGILGSTPASVAATGCFIEVLPNLGDTVTLNRGATYIAYGATKLLYSGFTLTGNNWLDGTNIATAKLWFENCTISPATPNGTVGLGYRTEFTNFVNCTWTTFDELSDFSARIAYGYTGCTLQAGGRLSAQSQIIASKLLGSTADKLRIEDKSVSTAPLTHNIIYQNNFIGKAITSASAIVRIGDNANKSDISVIGNVFEAISGTQPALWICADSSTYTMSNLLVSHNTCVGERVNFNYNDSGTAAVARTSIHLRNNAFRSYNIKGDRFGTPNGNRLGNAATMNGVNCKDNRYDGTVDASFTGHYLGINVSFVTGRTTVYGQLGYTLDASLDGTGLGNGDYIPTVASVLYNHTLVQTDLSYDMNGIAL